MFYKRFQGIGLLAFILEINGIFLHIRQLLLMYGYSKTSHIYRINNAINIMTFIVFRLMACALILLWMKEDCERISPLACFGFSVVSSVLLVINVILFYRLIKSDFFSRNLKSGQDYSDIMINNNANNGVKSQ